MVSKALFDRRERAWVVGELVRLQSKISKAKSVFEKTFALHCSSGLFKLKSQHLNHFVDEPGRFESLSFTDGEPFQHFEGL